MNKKIILFTFLFILTSCSNLENTKKIEELESKIEQNNIFNKNIECKTLENNVKNELKKFEWSNYTYEIDNSSYSEKLNSCIYSYHILFKNNDKTIINYKIINYFTWEDLESKQCDVWNFITCSNEMQIKFFKYIK